MEKSRAVVSPDSKRTPVVLLVDDFDDARDLYTEYLTFNGCRVVPASSGAQALELAAAHHPDVIFLDIRMRDLSGIEVVKILRTDAQFATTPILALTAHAMEHEQQEARDAGFDEVIVKPCLPDVVLAAVQRMVHSRRRTVR